MKNVRNWFSYRRKKSLRLERQHSSTLNSNTTVIKEEPSTPASPTNTNTFPIENTTNSPINTTNLLFLPQVQLPFPLNPLTPLTETQMQANYQFLLFKNFIDNVRITQGIRLLYSQLVKRQQVFNSLNMNWELLRLLSSNNADSMNN